MRLTKFLFPVMLVVFTFHQAEAQTITDSTVKKSTVATLTDAQYNALLTGNDLTGLGQVAELNHYPNPEAVLKFKSELSLVPSQVTKITAIAKELHRKKLEMGLIIIKNETVLDSLFRHSVVENGSLIFYANRSGLYQGELRNTILQACLATHMLLSHAQINKFYALQKAN